MTEEEIREQKLQICEQYGIMAALQKYAAGFKEAMQQFDASAFFETIEEIQAAFYKEARPPSYSLADARLYNATQRQRLKSYKNRIGSAAIRRPKRIARSCC